MKILNDRIMKITFKINKNLKIISKEIDFFCTISDRLNEIVDMLNQNLQ